MLAEELKAVMRRYPTGVTIVTTVYGGEPHGLTVNSFTSLSLDPPLVMVAIDRRAHSHEAIDRAGFYAVNILPHDLKDLAVRFATAPHSERFKGLETFTAKTGAPIIRGATAYLDCLVAARYPAGDHTIFVGQVVEGRVLEDKPPLIYYMRNYHTLP